MIEKAQLQITKSINENFLFLQKELEKNNYEIKKDNFKNIQLDCLDFSFNISNKISLFLNISKEMNNIVDNIQNSFNHILCSYKSNNEKLIDLVNKNNNNENNQEIKLDINSLRNGVLKKAIKELDSDLKKENEKKEKKCLKTKTHKKPLKTKQKYDEEIKKNT